MLPPVIVMSPPELVVVILLAPNTLAPTIPGQAGTFMPGSGAAQAGQGLGYIQTPAPLPTIKGAQQIQAEQEAAYNAANGNTGS